MNVGRLLLSCCPVGLLEPAAKLLGPHLQKKAKERSDVLLAQWRSENASRSSQEIHVEELATLLRSWGVPYTQIGGGAIPESDLSAIYAMIQERCPAPVTGVHVGNFVGVSLAYLASRLKAEDDRSLIVSIDPNLTFRGISETERMVTKLLRTLDLQDMVVRLNGYSMEKSMSNDGYAVAGYDPFKHYLEEDAPEWQLRNLTKLLPGKVDFALLDGNHEASYLRAEVEACFTLLRSGGCLFLDDISDGWVTLQREFESLKKMEGFDSDFIGTRTGVLIKK